MADSTKSHDPLRFLVVAGHPADTFDHCGGTMLHHSRRGDKITAVAMTHGTRVHDVVIAEELRLTGRTPSQKELDELIRKRTEVKFAEVKKACAIMGIHDIRFVEYDDSILLVTREMITSVARIIREVKPHAVITHYPMEEGGVASHHGNTGKITLYAIQSAANVWPDDPNPGWRVAQVFFMAPNVASWQLCYLSSHSNAYCDYFVDISDVIQEKVKALDCMRSQQYDGNVARKSIECWNGKEGFNVRVSYAESFITCYPEIGDYLKISNERLERANEPEAVMHERSSRLDAVYTELPE